METKNRKHRASGSNLSKQSADNYLDEGTLRLLRERDPQYLEALFIEVNPYLARVCVANGIYEEHADEVIHDTWERFFSNIEKFEGRSQVRTFICGILFNKIREYRRSESRTIYEEDSEKFLNSAFTQDGWWKTPPDDPYKLLELGQTSEFIKECMEGLTDQQKAAFVMREVEDEDSDFICNVLKIKLSNLRVLLFRAKDKLRKCLEGKVSAEQA